jgi:hypothetical protein
MLWRFWLDNGPSGVGAIAARRTAGRVATFPRHAVKCLWSDPILNQEPTPFGRD